MTDFDLELERFFNHTKTHKISDLALALDVSPITIRTWRTRQKIPNSAYRKLELTFEKSENTEKLSESELKNLLMEGLFRAIQIRAITLAEDAKINIVADILIKEITDNHQLVLEKKEQNQEKKAK